MVFWLKKKTVKADDDRKHSCILITYILQWFMVHTSQQWFMMHTTQKWFMLHTTQQWFMLHTIQKGSMLHTTQQCCPHLCLWQDLSLLHFLSHRNTRSENKPHSQCKYIWFLIYSTTICSNLCLIIFLFNSIYIFILNHLKLHWGYLLLFSGIMYTAKLCVKIISPIN